VECVEWFHCVSVTKTAEVELRSGRVKGPAGDGLGRSPVPISLESAMTCTVLYAQQPEHAPWEQVH